MAKYAKIIGSGYFPLDMLRYDKCYPISEQDSVAISSTFYNRLQKYEVNIKTVQSSFAVDRWRSFGVSIVTYKDYNSLINGKNYSG